MMLLHGLLVTAEEDNVYSVRDCNRVLGYVVRYYVPSGIGPSAKKTFRAFGDDFESLSEACAEYLKIKGCCPRNPLGDCEGVLS